MIPVSPPDSSQPAPSRGFWFMRDIPTAFWLLLTVIATIVHRDIPAPRWLMIHLLLLGAITHAILVWSQYFSFALLRSRASHADRRAQNIRLIIANLGIVIVCVGVPLHLWPVIVIGAAALLVAVVWHAISLMRRSRSSLPGQFGRTIRYYVASAGLLAIGLVLGVIAAHEDAGGNIVLAHAIINVLGWVGLTVAGTVVTLWPTILRTRADTKAAVGAARALPFMALGVVVAAVGAMLAILPLLAIGLAGYLAGLVIIGISLWRATRQTPPTSFSAMSVGMALVWWAGAIVVLIIGTATAFLDGRGYPAVAELIRAIVPYLVAGFAAQVLIGALSYLIPVVLGGGPTPVRVGTAAFDRLGPLRVTVANAALIVCALPISSLMRVVLSVLYLIAMASFLVIMFLAMRAQRRSKRAGESLHTQGGEPVARDDVLATSRSGKRAGQAIAGLVTVVLSVAITAAAAPASLGWSAAATGAADAPVQTVQIEAADMRFTPDRIEVPVGTRLVIELTNTDPELVHDLVFENGVAGTRLSPGDSETIDVGVITEDLEGWCSIIGHREMGMTIDIVAIGAAGETGSNSSSADAADEHAEHSQHSGDHAMPGGAIDLMAEPGDDFAAFDAVLPDLPPASGPVTHQLTLTARDTLVEVAPGVTQTLWTFGDTAPGPVLHGRVGDTFEVTLVNDASMGHSIDFHAGALAPDEPMRTIAPGESLVYTFTATRSGIWMYHCATMPMTAHIANGMYGAVVIEPRDLAPVDRSYVLVQGEYYLGDHDGGEVDMQKIADASPDLVVFNGYANQYAYSPLPARVGERVRVWVLDAGIERSSSFHVVGGQFDTVWSEGRYLIDRATDTGSQALGLMPAQGGFVELVFPEAGHYPFVSHFMIDAERGASGIFDVKKD